MIQPLLQINGKAQNVAAQLVEMLIDVGIKRIYAVAGDSINAVNDAVRPTPKNERNTASQSSKLT